VEIRAREGRSRHFGCFASPEVPNALRGVYGHQQRNLSFRWSPGIWPASRIL